MLELASLVQSLTGRDNGIVFHPLPGDDPRQRRPDISLAWSELGWKPRVPVREGLKKTIEYFRHEVSHDPGEPRLVLAGQSAVSHTLGVSAP